MCKPGASGRVEIIASACKRSGIDARTRGRQLLIVQLVAFQHLGSSPAASPALAITAIMHTHTHAPTPTHPLHPHSNPPALRNHCHNAHTPPCPNPYTAPTPPLQPPGPAHTPAHTDCRFCNTESCGACTLLQRHSALPTGPYVLLPTKLG
jgi:hypothetical protein